MSNIKIAQKAEMQLITENGAKLRIYSDASIQYGLHKAKLR